MASVVSILSGAKGFDFNGTITGAYAACAVTNYGMSFVGRYVPLAGISAAGDLTSAEAVQITENGLAILVVQHCHVKGTTFPNYTTQGTTDANAAISYLNGIGAPSGLFVYCDIENFDNAPDAAAWATAWAQKINASGTYKAAYYGPQNVLTLITGPTLHGRWESTGEGPLTSPNISQAGQSTPSCGTITVDDDTMVTSLGGFWGY